MMERPGGNYDFVSDSLDQEMGEIEQKHGLNELMYPVDNHLLSRLQSLIVFLEGKLDDLERLLEEGGNNQMDPDTKEEMLRRVMSIRQQRLLEHRVLVAYLSGVLENCNFVHIHDICGAYGLTSIAIAALRAEGSTSVKCFDWDENEVSVFELYKRVFGRDHELLRFVKADIRDVDFENCEQGDTYWFATQPENMVDYIITRAMALGPDNLPKSIVIITVDEYNHKGIDFRDQYRDDAEIYSKDWDDLREIVHENWAILPGHGHVRYGSAEKQQRSHRAIKLMDCLRAKYINANSALLRAKVCELPCQWANALIIKASS